MLTLPHMGINDIIEPVQVGGSERTNGHSLTHPLTHCWQLLAGGGASNLQDSVLWMAFLEVFIFWRFAVF